MKTIAITIDDDLLAQVDRLAKGAQGRSRNRSRVIREAVAHHVARLGRAADEEHEATVIRRHRARLDRQTQTLVRQQAVPKARR